MDKSSKSLRGSGFEVEIASNAMDGLRVLSARAPELVIVELDMDEKDGAWMIRRIRDDYVGKPPRILTLLREGVDTQRLEGLKTDAVLLKPLSEEMLVAAAAGVRTVERSLAADVLRELGRLTTLSADVDTAFEGLARQLARILRTRQCIVQARVGDSTRVASSQPLPDGVPSELELLAELAERVRAPLMSGGGDSPASTVVSIPLLTPQGESIGRIILEDRRHRLLPGKALDWLRDLGKRLSIEISWRSIHQRIAADRDRLRERAMFDPMLGVLTRTSFEQQLPVDIAALQQRKEPTTVAVFDVRGMRDVNDRFGHRAGDRLLKHVASMLTRELRHGDLLARYQGDRFAVALLGTSVEKAMSVVERLSQAVSTPLKHKSHEITPRVCAGISPVVGAAEQAVTSLARAAGAAKRGKDTGRAVLIADTADAFTPEAESAGLPAGTNLGGMYEVIHEISRGAMGVVYRAEDLGLGRPVALKTLRPDLARDEELIALFRREAATLAKLRHDHLVQVYAFGVDEEQLYFAMELVEGQAVEDRIDEVYMQGDFVPLSELRAFLPQIASALDELHGAHILHRDVKPANIVHDRRRRRAVLVDFGIASSEEAGSPAGTPGYAAPEIFAGKRQGPYTDVYGLAATAYAVLTNDLPFFTGEDTDTFLPTLQRQTKGPPDPIRGKRPDLPEEVDRVLSRALQPDPGKRYQTASEFAQELRKDLDGVAEEPHDLVARGKPTKAKDTVTTWQNIEPDPQRLDTAPTGDTPCSRGVLIRSAHQLVMAPQVADDQRRDEALTARAATLPGTGWLTLLASRDELLMEPLGPQGSPSSWYPTEAFVRLLTTAGENGQDALAFAQLLGKTAAANSFVAFYGAAPSHAKLADILKTADLFWHRYHNWGQIEVVQSSASVDLMIQGGPAHPLICASTLGMLQYIAATSAEGGAEISHPSCQADGASACIFRVVPQLIV
jgi:diguanylate cyclase (GGDEF)-like protein